MIRCGNLGLYVLSRLVSLGLVATLPGICQPYEELLDFRKHPRFSDTVSLEDAGVIKNHVRNVRRVAQFPRFVVLVIRIFRQFTVWDAVSNCSVFQRCLQEVVLQFQFSG